MENYYGSLTSKQIFNLFFTNSQFMHNDLRGHDFCQLLGVVSVLGDSTVCRNCLILIIVELYDQIQLVGWSLFDFVACFI